MSGDNNAALAREFFERQYAGDVDGAMAMLADDAVWWLIGTLPASGSHVGPEAIRTRLLAPFAPIWEGGSGQTPDIRSVIADGEHVVLEITAQGTTGHGSRYENFYCYALRVRDGRIDRIRTYTDTGYALGVLWGPLRDHPPID